jgi:hypothetical protein
MQQNSITYGVRKAAACLTDLPVELYSVLWELQATAQYFCCLHAPEERRRNDLLDAVLVQELCSLPNLPIPASKCPKFFIAKAAEHDGTSLTRVTPSSASGGSHGRGELADQALSTSSIRRPCLITSKYCLLPSWTPGMVLTQTHIYMDIGDLHTVLY